MKKIDWLTLGPQIKEVWRLSLPAILTQITTIVMQYIDSAMVGSLGAGASAAIGLVSTHGSLAALLMQFPPVFPFRWRITSAQGTARRRVRLCGTDY